MTSMHKRPSLGFATIPILFLIVLLVLNVILFGDGATGGANQIALILSTALAALLCISSGFKWPTMLEGISKSIASAIPAIMILLLIGALTGTWLLSGVIPTMIYYGLELLHPGIFLFAASIISAVVSLATGSSWSTIGTVGVALLGIGEAMGFSAGLVAGAIISGAYFGDKMSPLSDTTNLAPAMAGTDLFTHIRHMARTTVPTITISLIIFLLLGLNNGNDLDAARVEKMLGLLHTSFHISPVLFLVPVSVIVLILLKVKAIPALLAGILMGVIFGLVFQPEITRSITEKYTLSIDASAHPEIADWHWNKENRTGTTVHFAPGRYTAYAINTQKDTIGAVTVLIPAIQKGSGSGPDSPNIKIKTSMPENRNVTVACQRDEYIRSAYGAAMLAMYGDIAVDTGDEEMNELLRSGGMAGMLGTIWLIVCAMGFGGIMEVSGMLQRITDAILVLVKSTGSLIASTAGTCLFFNLTASDQYLAIVVPGRMFSSTYRKHGLKPENLSRTLEDSGTVTSALIPWNTCGAYHSGVLGVATGDYFMYAFFNLISPVMSIIFGYMGWKISRYSPEEMAIIETEKANHSASAPTAIGGVSP